MADDPVAHAEDVIARADDLQDRITEETKRTIANLVHFQERSKLHTRIILGLIIVILCMMAIGTFALIKIHDNAATIQQTCETLNQTNSNQILLWEHILELPPTEAETPEEKQQKVEFEQFIQETFQVVNCTQPKVLP